MKKGGFWLLKEKYDLSVLGLLKTAVLHNSSRKAISDGSVTLTYQEIEDESQNLASGLSKLGIKQGDRVAVSLPNWYEFVVIDFALAKLGAILIPFNTRFRKDEVTYILNNSGAKAVFFPKDFDQIDHLKQYQELRAEVPALEHLFSVRFDSIETISYHEILKLGQADVFFESDINPIENVHAIIYTSGTTGKPKGAMLTHKNLVHTAVATAEWMSCTPEDVFLLPTPIFHVMGLMMVLRTIASEAKMVLMEKFKAETAMQLVESEKVTILVGVPTMFILELNHPSFQKYDLSSLRTGEMGGAPAPIEIIRRIRKEMGCNILIGYGMTETSPTLSLTSFDDNDQVRSETVGKPLPGVEVKIVDEYRNPLMPGEVGELACRSFGLMKGYYKMPDKTGEVVDEDNWYYTGDLATIDSDGYIRIVGRKKEMIIRGGYNIYPREVEEHFYTNPKVVDVAIVGLPDSVLGEISCCCLLLKPDIQASEEEMLDFIKAKVADYKVPDKIVFVNEFPMTPSNKIKKIQLQQELTTKLQLR